MGESVKHLFITGGVVSSLGKGITAASVALLLKQRDYTVFLQKLDPYLNVDPGTMRLGAYPCVVEEGSKAFEAYETTEVTERHRHRFEFNNQYREILERAGSRFTGLSPDGNLVEVIERPDNRWFVAVQFHPEFKSRPLNPHPLFSAFINAAFRGKQK